MNIVPVLLSMASFNPADVAGALHHQIVNNMKILKVHTVNVNVLVPQPQNHHHHYYWDNKDGSDDDEGSSDSNPGHHGGFPHCHPASAGMSPNMEPGHTNHAGGTGDGNRSGASGLRAGMGEAEAGDATDTKAKDKKEKKQRKMKSVKKDMKPKESI